MLTLPATLSCLCGLDATELLDDLRLSAAAGLGLLTGDLREAREPAECSVSEDDDSEELPEVSEDEEELDELLDDIAAAQ